MNGFTHTCGVISATNTHLHETGSGGPEINVGDHLGALRLEVEPHHQHARQQIHHRQTQHTVTKHSAK